ncbi:hypothetical protein Lal_00020358 [Lupinus albus]|nr:hypothetical protein Lal_00020358 [Lupinus albus]
MAASGDGLNHSSLIEKPQELIKMVILVIRVTKIKRSGNFGRPLQKGASLVNLLCIILLCSELHQKISRSSRKNGLQFAFNLCFDPS